MKFLRTLYDFLRDTYKDRFIIFELTKRDYKNKYIGSTLGFIWAIINPFMMILIMWFIFEKGLKIPPVPGNIPFIAWLAPAMIAWDFFTTAVLSSITVFNDYSYLVKKINFRISMLPIVKLLSSAITHSMLLAVVIVALLIHNISFSIYWFQIVYYFVANMTFLFGLILVLASLQVFIKDIVQIMGIALSIGFWFTPIFWNFAIVPQQYQFFFKLNPMFYIIEGYRRSLIYHAPFWEARDIGIYFWSVTLIIWILAIFIYKKLKPHFADVL